MSLLLSHRLLRWHEAERVQRGLEHRHLILLLVRYKVSKLVGARPGAALGATAPHPILLLFRVQFSARLLGQARWGTRA
jgi:hypothetical protein